MLLVSVICDECDLMCYDNYLYCGESILVVVCIEVEICFDGFVIEWYFLFMMVWIVYLEDELGFIGVFDIEEDVYEF